MLSRIKLKIPVSLLTTRSIFGRVRFFCEMSAVKLSDWKI